MGYNSLAKAERYLKEFALPSPTPFSSANKTRRPHPDQPLNYMQAPPEQASRPSISPHRGPVEDPNTSCKYKTFEELQHAITNDKTNERLQPPCWFRQCLYSRGSLRSQRIFLMTRLQQINNALARLEGSTA